MASSMAVMPKLQMSALKSYPDCLITSGDIQYGVPTNVFYMDEMGASARSRSSPTAKVGENETYLLCHGRRQLARHSEVGELDWKIKEDMQGLETRMRPEGWRPAR